MKLKKNVLLWNYWANLKQTLLRWSLPFELENMSIYEILPALDLTHSVHAKISTGMHQVVKLKISRIPLIGLETRLGWRTDRKFLRNPNLNEIRKGDTFSIYTYQSTDAIRKRHLYIHISRLMQSENGITIYISVDLCNQKTAYYCCFTYF